MSRHGRSHRGRHDSKKKASAYGNLTHRDRVARRKEARRARAEMVDRLITEVVPICARSRIGIAVEKGGYFYHALGVDGLVLLRRNYGVGGTVIGYKTISITKWEDVLNPPSADNNWEPLLEKSALELLAECSE